MLQYSTSRAAKVPKLTALAVIFVLIWGSYFLLIMPRETLGYNPMLDPATQLSEAMSEARRTDREVLLIGGGDWCTWCWHLKEMLDADPALSQSLHESFVVVKIFWRQPSVNQAFINQFEEMNFAPFLILLDQEEKVLMAKAAADFLFVRKEEAYSPNRLRQFIRYWLRQRQLKKQISGAIKT